MSTSGDVQYIWGHHDACGGYHEFIEGCSVHRGFQYESNSFINLLLHMNHDISRFSEHPPMYRTHIVQGGSFKGNT